MSTKVPITILLGEKRFVPSSSDVFLQEISVAFQRRDLFALDFGGFVPVAHGHDGLMELLLFEAFRLLVMWDPCEALRPWFWFLSPVPSGSWALHKNH